jgi:hypothetical protein
MRHPLDSRLRRPLAGAVAICALAATPAGAQSPDSVDRNRDAAARQALDARGPDGVTPDARDAADGRFAGQMPAPVIVRVTRTQAEALDWGDVAIGAGGATGLLLVAAGGLLTVRRRTGIRTA